MNDISNVSNKGNAKIIPISHSICAGGVKAIQRERQKAECEDTDLLNELS